MQVRHGCTEIGEFAVSKRMEQQMEDAEMVRKAPITIFR